MADQSIISRKRSVLFYAVAGVLLFALIVLLFLPSLVSTQWAGNKARQAINSRIPGQVDFKSLSLSWFSGLWCEGLTYDYPAEGIALKVAEISTAKGLLALAANYHELGEVTFIQPVVYLTLMAKPAPAAAGKKKDAKVASNSPTVTKQAEAASSFGLPPIDGNLVVRDGGVVIAAADKQEKSVVQKLELQVHVTASANLLEYQLSFLSGDGAGQAEGKGTVNLPNSGNQSLAQISSQAMLDIQNWQLADFLSIIAGYANTPEGSGLINGHLEIAGSTETALKITGDIKAGQLRLQGGPLKSDTPYLENVNIALDGAQTAAGLTVNKLTLTSPLVNGTVSGSFDSLENMDAAGTMSIDLAEASAQFPGSLNLKKGIKISAGELTVNAKATADKDALHFAGDVRLDSLRGSADSRKIAWNEPVTLVMAGEHGAKGLNLDKFSVESSFLNGKGRGDMEHLQIQLAADLDLALKEIEKFIDLDGWQAGGKMDLNLQLDSKTAPLRSAVGDISISDFALRQNGRVVAPPGAVKAHLTSDLRLDDAMHLEELLNTDLNVQAWLGSGNIAMKSFMPPSAVNRARITGLDAQGTVQLSHVATLLQSVAVLPKDTRLSGTTNLQARGSLKDDKLELVDAALDARDIEFISGTRRITEKTMRLATSGSAELQKKSAELASVDLQTSAVHLTLPELLVANWTQLENSMKTNGDIEVDLGMLVAQFSDFIKLPTDNTVDGKGAIKVGIDMADARQQIVKLDGSFGPLKVSLPQKPVLEEDRMQVIVELKGDIRNQNFAVSKLEVAASPVSLHATGKIEPAGSEHQLTSEGSLGLNLQAINGYLQALTDLNVEMSGKADRPFTIKAQSSNGKWHGIPQNATLSTSFYADSIKAFGVNIQSLDVPVKLAAARAEVDVRGTVNGGTLVVKPAVDFSAPSPVVTLPENSQVLTKVGITEDMTRNLLAKVHPVFQGSFVSQGTVDLAMKKLSWPLDSGARKDAAFDGLLTFTDVKLVAGGLLAPLLGVMKVDEKEISLGSQPIECIAANERVRCSDLEIKLKDYTMTMAGSIGFDQSLDYAAKIPVTRRMVGGDMFPYLEGTSITVPISGTVSKPVISRNVVQTALKDLISQAGKKQLTDQAGKLLQKLFK